MIETPLTKLTGVHHPLVQTGMGWVAGPRLVSATANAGALGILASSTMSPDRLRSAVREIRARTDAPFGVNLRADAADAAERVQVIIDEGVRPFPSPSGTSPEAHTPPPSVPWRWPCARLRPCAVAPPAAPRTAAPTTTVVATARAIRFTLVFLSWSAQGPGSTTVVHPRRAQSRGRPAPAPRTQARSIDR